MHMSEPLRSQQQGTVPSSDCGSVLAAAVRQVPETPRTSQPIYELSRGYDVLVVGALGNYSGRKANSKWEQEWEFYKLGKLCRSIVGIDIDPELVRLAGEDGHDIRLADAESFNLNAKFDVIYATHIIEHLNSPGSLLIQSLKHLKRGGVLIVETPNPFGINVAGRVLFKGTAVGGPQPTRHTCWIDEQNAEELGRRSGLQLIRTCYYTAINPFGLAMKIRTVVYMLAGKLRKRWNCNAVYMYQAN